MLNRLREVFSGFPTLSEEKQAHRDDHLALHQAYNDRARMSKPSTPANNTANLKAALADSISGGVGRTLYIPPGNYIFDDLFLIENVLGLRIVGDGAQTRLVSRRVADSGALFELRDTRETTLTDLNIFIDGMLGAAIRSVNKPGGSMTPSFNLFENLRIESSNKYYIGIHLGGDWNVPGSGVDANNDFHTMRRLYVGGYLQSGCHLRAHSQSYGNEFRGCYFFGGTGAEHAVNAGGNYGGNFAWYGGFVGGHTKSDFNIGRSYQPYIIHGMNSEVSARFITADSQAYCTIEAKANRWAGNAAHADGKIIKLSGDVTATFENNVLGDGSGDRALTIELANLQAVSSVKFNNNRVFSSAAAVFDTTAPHEMSGNSQFTHEGNGTKKVLTA